MTTTFNQEQNPEFGTPAWRMMNDDERTLSGLKWQYGVTGELASNRSSDLYAFLSAGGTIARYYGDSDYSKADGSVVKMDAHLRLLIAVGLVEVVRRDSWYHIELAATEATREAQMEAAIAA